MRYMIECLKCKKKYDDSATKCVSCGNIFDDWYKINYFNIKAKKYDRRAYFLLLCLCGAVVFPLIVINVFYDSFTVPVFYIIYMIVLTLLFIPLSLLFRYRRNFFRKKRDSLVTDEYDICFCGYYKRKNGKCDAVHVK